MKNLYKQFLLALISTLFLGCSENYISQIHSKSVLEKDIECLKLTIFPPNQQMQDSLTKLYNFDEECEMDLYVSYKNAIVCNSNQNSEKKLSGMAKSYLRLELKEKNRLYYSYYIDLEDDIKESDLQKGFKVFRETLPIKAK